MAAAAPAAEGADLSAAPVADASSNVAFGEEEGVGSAGAERDGLPGGAETLAESEEDEEDVFEVEKILDMKTEGGRVLYKVRWKGYASEDDTWEPEVHLEDCKEVLLEFRRKNTESKAKAVRKDIQRLSLNKDIFEANSDSDQQSETKEETSPRKKKKPRPREEKNLEDVKKKKAKTGKVKEQPSTDPESSPERLVIDLRTKKRILEGKEELKDSKKPKKDELKELKKAKKGELKDLKTKVREDPKENRKVRKEKSADSPLESEFSVLHDSSHEQSPEELLPENRDEKDPRGAQDPAEQGAEQEGVSEKEGDGTFSAEEDAERKGRKKKRQPRKTEDPKESGKPEKKGVGSEKKAGPKKQRQGSQDQGKGTAELDRLTPTGAQTQPSWPAATESGLRAPESGEQEKEPPKNEPKEKYQKSYDSDKEERTRREPKGPKTVKEIRNTIDLLKKTSEEKNDVPEANRNKDTAADWKSTEEQPSREGRQTVKDRRSAREECDTWAHIAAEGDQELLDSVLHSDENPDGRHQSLGVDLQLEWMKLEDFQRHLDGGDESFAIADAIPSNLLRDAVKNGDYITVKVALNSSEEYDLDQEDSSGMTLVMLAAAGGQDDLLRLLITKGAKVNGRQKNGTTALIHAAEKNFLTTVAILLEAGAFVNVQQSNGETALMKACKRGNSDIVRLVIECGADCNILSKHQNSALHFAKQSNNVLVYDLLKSHLETLSRVAEETIKDYFEDRLVLLEPVFPIACHRLCEGPDFSTDFHYKPPQNIPEGSGVLLFIFHANFLGKEVIARLCGPCSVQAVVLNDKFQLPVFLDSHFVYSFSPVAGPNKLFLRLTEAPAAKVKLLIGAYRVQLQ
ncbi:M-phase phosphoprotein 8-like isoform X2 [Ochotona curzoniae]|uniref:M-phase phosphoprotein 8 isoform X2 n=1 Tax=Ochotona curzoniae TaxID=130825 RepID=UPI001B345E78|nr:M-phase phosphoprotein 8 isoform X2 [Ochotona curzoniae]XP_040853765.1 M-phase phosphoprotein 8-like isoform X2 [Ochotona curzoniae]